MQNAVCDELLKAGFKACFMSVNHLVHLKRDIENTCTESGMSDKFSSFITSRFNFEMPDNLPDARSIMIAAVPSPGVRVFFYHNGKKVPLFIPPTYIDMSSAYEQVIKQIKALPETQNYNMVKAKLPEKLLAVRSRLGFYGRNNICYVPGMGSFAKLAAFFTDIPCEEDNWYDVQRMDACKNCSVCSNKCPTGSISKERTVINAEKCICYKNEKKGIFPDWLDSTWHNSIVGCFLCQEACPENRDYLKRIVDMGEFSREETELLLNDEALQNLPLATKEKLERMNMVIYHDCLSRNLKVLLDKAE